MNSSSHFRFLKISLLSFALLLQISLSAEERSAPQPWDYDPGPDPATTFGKELIDLNANIPYMPGISKIIMRGDRPRNQQKFRPAFGPITWRMRQPSDNHKKGAVKILFIGQDGTHVAEAAARPATAGFGGRAQDLANYFGVNESAGFINTYAFTIRGQYGGRFTPYIERDSKDRPVVQYTKFSFVDEDLWLLTHEGPVAEWRNNLIDWILRNNSDTIKMIVTFGGAARDSVGTFLKSRGAEVGTKFSLKKIKKVEVPETKLKSAGGNNEFPVPVARDGGDLYEDLLGREIKRYSSSKDQSAAQKVLKDTIEESIKKMVFSKAGPYKNGILDPAQFGGYSLDKIKINGRITRNLKGLKLSDGQRVKNDVLVIVLPHPTFLSYAQMDHIKREKARKDEESKGVSQSEIDKILPELPSASEIVACFLKKIKDDVAKSNWKIDPDPGQINQYAGGKSYTYLRSNIGPEYYDFGAPDNRMVPVSSAKRLKHNVIGLGVRTGFSFDKDTISDMTNAKPAPGISPEEMFTAPSRSPGTRYIFDSGPGEYYARLMIENLPLIEIFKPKCVTEKPRGKSWHSVWKEAFKKHGINAFNVKSHPDVGDFGHYRGTFKNPQVLIVADPDGYDDIITSRALTGTRGQYLQGLMNNMGINDGYLVIKTVPFGMDDANKDEWKTVLELTQNYRNRLIATVLKENNVDLILTDGKYATAELKRIFGSKPPAPHVQIKRQGTGNCSGIKTAAKIISKIKPFKKIKVNIRMENIPRSHLSYYARVWEGTSGDRVLNDNGKLKGQAFAEVAPRWAWSQDVEISPEWKPGVEELLQMLNKNGFPRPNETIPGFLKRMDARRDISPFFPKIQINGIFFSIDGLCVDGDKIRPFKPYRKVCVERGRSETGDCTLYEEIYISTPRFYSAVECVEWETNDRGNCVHRERVDRIIPLTWDVELYDNRYSGEGDRKLLGTEKFTIPDCL